MREWLWRRVAWLVTRPGALEWLQRHSTVYSHIGPEDNRYMLRYWLFNPYGLQSTTRRTTERTTTTPARWRWLPSVRLHCIMRPDQDRHLHDHPWNARTIVLRGAYVEERPAEPYGWGAPVNHAQELRWTDGTPVPRRVYVRSTGYTGRLLYGQYHRISLIPTLHVWTLFFTWRERGDWGFAVDGAKVPHGQYLKKHDI